MSTNTKSHDAGIKSHDAGIESHDVDTKSHDAATKSHDADTHIEIKSHDALLSHMITAYYILPTQLALYMKLTWQLSGTSAAHRQTGEVSKPKNVVRQTNKIKHGVESGKQHTRGDTSPLGGNLEVFSSLRLVTENSRLVS